MSIAQHYNKVVTFEPLIRDENFEEFDLNFLTYYGKLSIIVEQFNNQPLEKSLSLVQNSFSEDQGHNALQIASFLNFSNIFLYLLTFGADPNKKDKNSQNTWHILGYKGHPKLSALLLNYIRYRQKMEILAQLDEIKAKSGFSNLDIVRGKLSRAVRLNEENIKNFEQLQNNAKDLAIKLIDSFFGEIMEGLLCKDNEQQTPFHLAAMSKFPLCHKFIIQILDFDYFKLDETWKSFLSLFLELQRLESKVERMNQDPRKCLRLERELTALLGDNIIDELSEYFNLLKKKFMIELINTQDNNGDSILHISSFHGDFKIVSRLVFYNGDKKLKNNKGLIPVDLAKDNFVRKVLTDLNKAAKASDEKNIEELINFGKDINEKISIFSQAPIHKIIESQDPKKHDVLRKMLDLGSDPNLKDSNGWSALHYACQLGDFESVQILLNNRAIIDAYSNNKRIPLHLAAYRGYPEIVEYLLSNESDPNFKDELGCTPLHLAAKKGHVRCIEILLNYDADLYCLDFRSWNILHYASFHGHKKAVRFISKYDADYDFLQKMRNSQNKLPIEIIRDPSIKHYFYTLWHAAREGNLDLTRNLLNEGEDVNEQSHFELNTPLHLAVLNNHYLEVKLLIENNAIPDAKNKDGIEPYHYAAAMNGPLKNIYDNSEDLERDTIDLRDIVRCMVDRVDGVIDSMVSEKNWNLRIWTALDFNIKIIKLLESILEEIIKEKENEDDNEEEEEEHQNPQENNIEQNANEQNNVEQNAEEQNVEEQNDNNQKEAE